MTDVLKREMQDGVLILTMNRPERRNALDANLMLALLKATVEAAEDPAVRVVLLTGAGGHFSVGGDVKAMDEGQGRDRSVGERIHALRDRMNASRYLHDEEARNHTLCALTNDHKEAAAAFVGKRKPKFTGT